MRVLEVLRKLFGPHKDAVGEASSRLITEDEETELDPFNPFAEPVRLEITDVFDLHSIAPRDVKPVVIEYLAQARDKGFRQVRIIHGKGVGVQREIVRSVLSKTEFVEHFTDAPPEAGGWGATIVRLSIEGSARSESRL